MTTAAIQLPKRWTHLKPHKVQMAYHHSPRRFNIVPAGRRSGKTEIAKRRLVRKAISFYQFPDGWFIAAAPTHAQARRIYWSDLKRLVPPQLVSQIKEGEPSIYLYNGAKIQCMGLDEPARVEGPPLDGIILDEYGNMKESVWFEHVRPSLSTPGRLGSADVIGVPEGRNHYYDLWMDAQVDPEWGPFHWKSADILDPHEIEVAKRQLDPLSYEQEYEGSFVTFTGRAYYTFSVAEHVRECPYRSDDDLILAFDFNISPGVCAIAQEFEDKTCFIDEVYIPRSSNTRVVCEVIKKRYKNHKGQVKVYGDATGGAGGSAKVDGSDYDIIKAILKPVFQERLRFRVPDSNPRQRARVNAVNARLKTVTDEIHTYVDPKCRRLIKDFDGVRLLEGGSGELDKKGDPKLTHISDGAGYYIAKEFPTRGKYQHKIVQI